MELNSRLYIGSVYHNRLVPKKHSFRYPAFSFCFDLDELPLLHEQLKFFSNNGFGLYNFRDSDHLDYGSQCLKDRLSQILVKKGYSKKLGRVELLANPSVFGFVFNPLSIYFCYSEDGNPYVIVCEICNNFFERKVFVLDFNTGKSSGAVCDLQKKNFYISPYCRVDDELFFQLKVPGNTLDIRVDTLRDDEKIIETHLTGKVEALNDKSLFNSSLSYPLYSMAVFARIHLQAFYLLAKGVSYYDKDELSQNQLDLFRPHKSLRQAEATNSRELIDKEVTNQIR